MLKKLIVFILFPIVIISMCIVLALHFSKPILKRKFSELAEGNLCKKISFAGLDIALLKTSVCLEGVKIEDVKGIKYQNSLNAKEIILNIDLPSLFFRRDIVFNEISLINCSFSINNSAEALLSGNYETKTAENPAMARRPKKMAISSIYVKKLLIEDSKFYLEDYSVPQPPAIIDLENINGAVSDLSIGLAGGALRGNVSLACRPCPDEKSFLALLGSFSRTGNETDFDFDINIGNLDLVRFSPYYSNTSFAILKKATLDLDSKAACQKNQLKASQNARIYNVALYDIRPLGLERLFGLPAKTVVDFFRDAEGNLKFDFNVIGTLDDPKFDPGPAIQQVLSNAMRDKIVATLQELPREMIKMSEQAIKDNLHGADMNKQDEVKESIQGLGKEFNKVIRLEPQLSH